MKKEQAVFLFIITIFFYPFFGKTENVIVITNFINESGYSGDWDIENEFPRIIREVLIKKKNEIPVLRKRHWRENILDLKEKFPSRLVISGRISEFSYTSQAIDAWPVTYLNSNAEVSIILEIIKDDEIYTESCSGEEAKKDFKIQIISRSETEVDELAGVKFWDSTFKTTLPGKATKKAIDECISKIEKYLY